MAASGIRNGVRSLFGLGAQQGCFVNLMPIRLRKNFASTMCVARAADFGKDVPELAVIGLPTRSNSIRQCSVDNNVEAFRWCVELVHKKFVRSHSSSLHGLCALLYLCSHPFMDKEKLYKSCTHHIQLSVPMLQRNPRSPDFKHKVTRKSLWEDGWSTPAWVKAKLKLLTLGRSQFHADYGTRDAQGYPKVAMEKRPLPIGARESSQIAQGGGGSMQNARTKSEAIAIMKNCLQKGISIGSYMVVQVLKQCFKQEDLVAVKQVHNCIIKSRMDQNAYVANNLLSAYARCGRLQDACQVFDELVMKNIFSWTIMIGAYARSGCGLKAYQLFLQMIREGINPDAVTYVTVLSACASAGALEWVKNVHRHAHETGLQSDVRVGSALVHMYAKSGSINDAQLVFDRMEERDVISWNIMIGAYAESGAIDVAQLVFDKMEEHDVISWNIMIGAYAKNGRGIEAYQLFLQMIKRGFKPDTTTYVSLLNACASVGALEWVKDVHKHAHEAGLESDMRVGNALVHMYAKSGNIDVARLVFDKLENRDVITWNMMIGGLAQHGCGHEALGVFRKMIADGVKPDDYSFVAVLLACSHAGLVDDGRRLFLAMLQDHGVEPNVVHYTCMVDLLGRAGHLEDAKLCIDNMPLEPNGATWKALLGACKTHGNVELGKLAFKKVINLEPKEASAWVLLSNIYAAAGMREEVSLVRTMMQKRGIRKEPGCTWISVDSKIHHFFIGDKSHPEAKEIYALLKRLTEEIKVVGYIPDTRLVLLDIDEVEKELTLSSHSEKLAIAYGLLWIPFGKPIHVYKNLRMCSDCHATTKFISKVTRRDIVARDALRFHYFKDGVCSCDDYW